MLEGLYWALFYTSGLLLGVGSGWFLLMGARHHSQNMYKNLMQQQQQQQQQAQSEEEKPVEDTDTRKYYDVRETMKKLKEDDIDEAE